MIRTVISDFGGVLTTPLAGAFAAYRERSGLSAEELGQAMQRAAVAAGGHHPLFQLEKGLLTEDEFVRVLEEQLEGRRLGRFRDIYFDNLEPNVRMIDYMRELHARGLRMALLTNNVREWEPLWRAKLPVDEIFDVVVDSAFVGTRKPEPRIYRLTLERLGPGTEPAECLFVDDLEINCEAARTIGMSAVQFRDNDQAIAEIESALDEQQPVQRQTETRTEGA